MESMVVLAVTWQANLGKEAEVAAIFRKLEEASRTRARMPYVRGAPASRRAGTISSSTSSIRTTERWKHTATRRISRSTLFGR